MDLYDSLRKGGVAMSIVWLVLFVIFLVVEGITFSLTSIWFAGGAVAALLVQVLGGGWKLQLTVFTLISLVLLALVRPLASKVTRFRKTATNADSLSGRHAVVRERIDNREGTGKAALSGELWLARAANEGETFEPGEIVVISGISGAKLLVAAEPEDRQSGEI